MSAHELPQDPRWERRRPAPGSVRSFFGHAWDVDPPWGVPRAVDDTLGDRDAESAEAFRDVLSRFASGIVVVTGQGSHGPVGLTCQSFTSVSLHPPLVLFCPSRTSRAWPQIDRSGRFCANILAEDQREVAERFASRGVDKFAGLDWRPTASTGSPLLSGVAGHVDCTIEDVHPAGDHWVVIGRVVDLGVPDADAHGLTYHRRRYGSTGPTQP